MRLHFRYERKREITIKMLNAECKMQSVTLLCVCEGKVEDIRGKRERERWQQSKRLHWSEGEMTFDMAVAAAALGILNYICGSYLKSFHFISHSAFSPSLPLSHSPSSSPSILHSHFIWQNAEI